MNSEMVIENGTIKDFNNLSHFHYRSTRPAVASEIYRVVYRSPTVVSRFLNTQEESLLVGVAIVSYPTLGCAMREAALGNRYNGLPLGLRGAALNREIRTISRVILDPRWRGRGIAVKLVKHILGNATTPYVEAIAAMGRANPFFEHAGMTAYVQSELQCDTRLLAAFDHIAITRSHLSSIDRFQELLATLEQVEKDWIIFEMKRWFTYSGSNLDRVKKKPRNTLTIEDMLPAMRMRLWLKPVYYLFHTEFLKYRQNSRELINAD